MKTRLLTKTCLLLSLVALAAGLTVHSSLRAPPPENSGRLSADDYQFASSVATEGVMEVRLGRMTATNSFNSAVQQFGQRMVNDHGKGGQSLRQIAADSGATLPVETTKKRQRVIDELAGISGPDFDRAYIAFMVRCHKEAARKFKHAAETVENPELRTFAEDTLITVQDHLEMAESLDAVLGRVVAMNR